MKRTIDTETISTQPAPKIDEDYGSIGSVVTIKSSLTQNTDLYAWGPAIKALDTGKTDDYADQFQCLTVLVDTEDAAKRIAEDGVNMYFGDAGDTERSGTGMRITFARSSIYMYFDDGEGNAKDTTYYPRNDCSLGDATLTNNKATFTIPDNVNLYYYSDLLVGIYVKSSSKEYIYSLPVSGSGVASSAKILLPDDTETYIKYTRNSNTLTVEFGADTGDYKKIDATLRNY